MPKLMILTYGDEDGAEAAKASLKHLPREQLLLVEDALAMADGKQAGVALDEREDGSPLVVALPRALLASAFAGVFFLAAWGLTAVGMIGGTLMRNRKPVNRRTAQTLQRRIDSAQSVLVLIVSDTAPDEMLQHFSSADDQIMRASISAEQAGALKRRLRAGTANDVKRRNGTTEG